MSDCVTRYAISKFQVMALIDSCLIGFSLETKPKRGKGINGLSSLLSLWVFWPLYGGKQAKQINPLISGGSTSLALAT